MSVYVLMTYELAAAIQDIQNICDSSDSRSDYYEYGSAGYKDSIRHFLASSSEIAQLAVQPGSVKDLCKIMKVLKKYPSVQFAIKGGGHAMAPTYSSTTGILISMTRFAKVRYHKDTQLVDIGSGCLWDQVYSALAPTQRNIVGGASADGVGVAGWLLGAGYSLKSNRRGLGIDNVVAIEIVTPDGEARSVSLGQEKDLFQALRGGGNNFGIVTKFTVRTFAQNRTYGAYFLMSGTRVEEFKDAMIDYVENEQREEACVVAAFRHELIRGKPEPEYNISIFCVFDAEKPKDPHFVPFNQFSRLAETGEVWKADPAGWQLGKTHLSLEDSSLEYRSPTGEVLQKPLMPAKLIAPVEQTYSDAPAVNDAPESNSSMQYSMMAPEFHFDYLAPAEELVVPERLVTSGDSDLFEEMSFDRFYGVPYEPGVHANADGLFIFDNNKDVVRPEHQEVIETQSTPEAEEVLDAPVTVSSVEMTEAVLEAPAPVFHSIVHLDHVSIPQHVYMIPKDEELVDETTVGQRILVTKKIDKMGELNDRGRFGCLMISKYTKPLLDKMQLEAEKAAKYLKERRGLSIIVDAWPVHSHIFDNSPPGAAYPHKQGKPFGPLLAYFRWEDEKDDAFWLTTLQQTLDNLRTVAVDLGLTSDTMPLYNNLSLETVPVKSIYQENFEWLKQVKAKYDPTDVMSRCGGHKIPLPGDQSD